MAGNSFVRRHWSLGVSNITRSVLARVHDLIDAPSPQAKMFTAVSGGINGSALEPARLWALAGLLFASGGICLDRLHPGNPSTTILYITALLLGAHDRNPRAVMIWASSCLLLDWTCGGKFNEIALLSPQKLVSLVSIVAIALTLFYQRKRHRDQLRMFGNAVDERQELADALPHVVWGTNASGGCEFLNDRYTETFGILRSKGIQEQSWADPIHPGDRGKMYNAWRSAVENGNSYYTAHARMRMNDGSYRWMESIGRSVRSAETGETLKWFGSLVDVQNQVEDREAIKRLQFDLQAISDQCESRLGEADEKLRAIFETREIGWIEYDVNFVGNLSQSLRLRGVSDVREHLARYPADTEELSKGIRLLNASQLALSSLGFKSLADMASERAHSGHKSMIDLETAILTALVKQATTTCGMAKLSDAGGLTRVFPFTVSILEKGIAKVSLIDTSLSDDRAKAAGNARIELARVNRVAAASALAASLIHQISQPITAISLDVATATRLLASSGESSSAAVIKVMERLRWNTQRLSYIGTTTRNNLRSGGQTRVQVDIVELTRRSFELLLDPLDGRQKDLTIVADETLPTIIADPLALQQVMFALLQNALEASKVTGEQPDISVAIKHKPRSSELDIAVADRGSGIQNEHTACVFDPFFSTKPNRLGFGLTVCQSVVEGFGGTLTLANRPGGGATAEFTLPLK